MAKKCFFFILILLFSLLSFADQDNVKLIEEKVIKMSNPDWWDEIQVDRPQHYPSETQAWEQLDLIKKEVNGKKKSSYSSKEWPKYQIKAYIFVAGTYKENHPLRAEAFCLVGELYRNTGDLKRANTAYYNSVAQLNLSPDTPRKTELNEFCNSRILEMENEINRSGSSVMISEEK